VLHNGEFHYLHSSINNITYLLHAVRIIKLIKNKLTCHFARMGKGNAYT
jgi:hypothetical protein